MKTLKIAILFLLSASACFAQTSHHVYAKEIPWNAENSVKGNDKIYSITEAIAKADAGDSIIIHEGIYRETINVTKSNLNFKNHANDYVLITGTELIKGWTPANGMKDGIMQADISKCDIQTDFTQVFSNGSIQQMGRFPNNNTGKMMEPMDPNSGYALLDEISKDQGVNADCYALFKDVKPPKADLSGGYFRALVGKNRHYAFGEIKDVSPSGRITFKGLNSGPWKDADEAVKKTNHKFGWAFLFHKNLIDIPGEWFAEDDKLYYMPQTKNINSERIEMQVRKYVLRINNANNTSLCGLNFTAGLADMKDSNKNSITNCSFRYLSPFFIPDGYGMGDSGSKGFYIENCDNNIFANNYLAHNWGSMITLKNCNNSTMKNCVIKDFGWVAIFTAAVYLNGSDETSISKCSFGEAGRFHLRVDGKGGKLIMTDNDFYDAMKVGEDAGPIEVTSTGRIGALDLKGSVIAYNKVRDTYGIPVSAGNYLRQKITAFYMEDTENYTAHHNLIYNFMADNYDGEYKEEVEKHGEFLYIGPRYNPMYRPVHYYNNTVWKVNQIMGVWNNEIDNWKELGLTPPDTTGFMRDGHFANNIIVDGPNYKMSYVRKKISKTGGNSGYVTLNPSPSFYATSFKTFAEKAKPLGYEFKPENNVFFSPAMEAQNFVDAEKGDFSLLPTSSAVGAGRVIKGITSSDAPDCGAFEGGDRVMHAGAELKTPDFKEKK